MQVALNSSIFDRVILAIKQTTYTGDQKITSETRLACDLALGSFDRLKLAIYLEETFDVELSDDVLERAVTVSDIIKYIIPTAVDFDRLGFPSGLGYESIRSVFDSGWTA